MCKPNNEVFVPVLLGDEDAELMEERRAALLPARRQGRQEEEDDEGCDHITWLILLGGLLLVLAVYTMPCSCNFVDDVEQHGTALLRGATAKILRQQQQDGKIVASTNKDTARPRSQTSKPMFITRPLMSASDEDSISDSSESSSSDFHVYSGLPKSDSADQDNDDDFHVYSGLPKEPQDDDGFDLPMMQDTEAGNDDEEEVEDVVVYKMKTRPRRRRSSEHSSLPHGIFTTKWLHHNFVSFSGSDETVEPQLLESKQDSPSILSDEETSHTIPSDDDDDDMDSSVRATELSTSVGEVDPSHPGYTISYDEVYVSDTKEDESDDEMNVDAVLPKRRSLVGRKKLYF